MFKMQEVKETVSILCENTLRFSFNPHFKPCFSPFPQQLKGRPFLTQRVVVVGGTYKIYFFNNNFSWRFSCQKLFLRLF